MDLVFVTSNKNKARELSHITGLRLKIRNLELVEHQSLYAKEVAKAKAIAAYSRIKKPVIVEDTGIYIKAFGGFPGALAKWFVSGLGYDGVCRSLDMSKDRGAYAETCIAYYDGRRLRLFIGRVSGSVALHPHGDNNFGWDRIFIPKGHKKTFAQMDIEQKSKISMRGKAGRKLKMFLAAKA